VCYGWRENLARKNYLVIQIFAVLDGEVHGKALPSPRPRRLRRSGGPDVTICRVFPVPCAFPCLCRDSFLCRVWFVVFAVTLFFAVFSLLFCRVSFILCCVSLLCHVSFVLCRVSLLCVTRQMVPLPCIGTRQSRDARQRQFFR